MGSAQAEYRARLKAAGLCTRCGKRPAEAGKSTCTVCLDKLSAKRSGTAERRPNRRRINGATTAIIKVCPESADIRACLECKRRHCVFDTIGRKK